MRYLYYILFATFLNVVFFFLGNTPCSAIVVSRTAEEIRNTDIIATDIREDEVTFSYVDKYLQFTPGDEIGNNWERYGKTYKIYSGQAYHKIDDYWFTVEYATTTIENYNEAMLSGELSILKSLLWPKYAVADQYYSSVGDGRVSYESGASWATSHDSATANELNYTNDLMYGIQLYNSGGSTWTIRRGGFEFDTSAIDDGDTVSTSTLYVYVNATADTVTSHNICATTFNQTTANELVAGDYDEMGTATTSCETSLVTGGYNTWTIDTTQIDKTDYTFIGFRQIQDCNNQAPSAGTNVGLSYYFSEYTGTDHDPYLLVEVGGATSSPEATSTEATSGSVPIWNDITIITAYEEHYTDSTTTPSEVVYTTYHFPFLLWLVIFLITSWIFGRIIIELLIVIRQY